MDAFEVKLLNLVQQNNRMCAERLADKVGLSPSACQRRLKRLRETGAIIGDTAIVAPEVAGQKITAITRVTMDTSRPDVVDGFKRKIAARPKVLQCYNRIGSADFVLVLVARDMQEFDSISRSLSEQNPSVRRLETNIVIDHVKATLAVPIDGGTLAA